MLSYRPVKANNWPTCFGSKTQARQQQVHSHSSRIPFNLGEKLNYNITFYGEHPKLIEIVSRSLDGGTLMSVGGSGNVSSTATNSNNIIGSVVGGGTQGGTLIITTSAAQSDPSLYTNEINSTAITSTNTNSINSNANNNQTLNMGNLTKVAAIDKSSDGRLNHNDGNVTTINR